MHELAFLLQNIPDQPNPEMIQRLMMMIIPLIALFYVLVVALIMVPCWFILKKAGFSPWLSLLCLLPSLGTLVLLYVLAFAEWKVVPVPQVAWQPPAAAYPPPPVAPQV
jgi:hypothetical protein